MKLGVIGGGPAGLRAAEVAASAGASVTIFDAKPSVGRKLLVAGRGGLNLTHGEDLGRFISRYSGPADFWQHAISAFTPSDLREWAAGLGIETFEQRTGRVYPREMKAAPLLRRWVDRLRGLGVTFEMNHRWTGLKPGPPHELEFSIYDEHRTFTSDAVILALGGASWPITGSDGHWTSILTSLGIGVNPLAPANCGWETAWPREVLATAEGKPLKNLVVRAGDHEVKGELMVTSYGLEGGAIYQLGTHLRAMPEPVVHIDFKPTYSLEELVTKLAASKLPAVTACKQCWRLSDATHAIICAGHSDQSSATGLAERAKSCAIPLIGPRPIDEAISSAGGVRWDELDVNLMLRKLTRVFVAGEMIDWEATTGGYLMQGCFATGTLVGKAIAAS
ncbi:TIGR03862 family flavoprotein [Luteolibacter arcticus]|uniref:TIGR03862 family flavoprotein n=1 Tax=Luteolibacter arcticus TaxID=1581411 RepID=A0ABT3GIA6_9BACT|nr:TIGR03862 family flavoprotein [Luteolibacter arcticus]MCW1923254.1 TIGR03862 family flavoprotein [Luteolibacter arcticus]